MKCQEIYVENLQTILRKSQLNLHRFELFDKLYIYIVDLIVVLRSNRCHELRK